MNKFTALHPTIWYPPPPPTEAYRQQGKICFSISIYFMVLLYTKAEEEYETQFTVYKETLNIK
jgi:hypothetical protein